MAPAVLAVLLACGVAAQPQMGKIETSVPVHLDQTLEIHGRVTLDDSRVRRGPREWFAHFYSARQAGAKLADCSSMGRHPLFFNRGRAVFRTATCRLYDARALRAVETAYLQFHYEALVGTDPRSIPIGGGQVEAVPIGPRLPVKVKALPGKVVVELP